MRPAPSWLAVLLTLALPAVASAFAVEDHGAITEAALEAALEAGAPTALAAHRERVVKGSRAEDLNLHVKLTGWHHFFRPGDATPLPLRDGSEARVRALWEEAQEAASHGDLARAFDRVGHLAHHLEDMAVPMHVVPVMHGLGDRFEGHGVRRVLERPLRREVAPLSGEEAQRALAQETLEAVRTGALPAEGGAIPWSAFWVEPSKPGTFGRYGEAGNHFGDEQVRWQGRTWRVERAGYEALLDGRVEAAVAYTRAFLLWASERLTALEQARAPVLRRAWRPAPELSFELVGGVASSPRGSAPLAGARLLLPLPRSLGLSLGWTRGLGRAREDSGGWSLSLLSPPLWSARPRYTWGVDLRATLGAGLFAQEGALRPGVPVGLRARLLLGHAFSLGAEAQYRVLAPTPQRWAHGASFTLGVGYTWGDR
jgi:hypothetical protein